MELVDRSTKCVPASLNVGEAIKAICVNAEKALKDGWQPGQDVPAMLLGSTQDLLKAGATAAQLPEEAKLPVTMGKSVLIPVLEGIEILVQKAE